MNARDDAGLATERTHLSWQRTGLSFVGVGAFVLHASRGAAAVVLPATVAMAVGAWLIVVPRVGARTVTRLTAAAAVLLAISGLVSMLLSE